MEVTSERLMLVSAECRTTGVDSYSYVVRQPRCHQVIGVKPKRASSSASTISVFTFTYYVTNNISECVRKQGMIMTLTAKTLLSADIFSLLLSPRR